MRLFHCFNLSLLQLPPGNSCVGGGAYSYDGRHKVPTPSQLARSYSFMQRRERERERDGDRDEDDSMHEKYFMNPAAIRSVESTPQTRRYVQTHSFPFC